MYPGTCQDCGGSAHWTIIAGLMHYYCQAECDGFMQTELAFEEENIEVLPEPDPGAPMMLFEARDRSDSNLRVSRSPGRLGFLHPIAGLARRLLSLATPSSHWRLETPDPDLLPWQGRTDGYSKRLEQLVVRFDRAFAAQPPTSNPKSGRPPGRSGK